MHYRSVADLNDAVLQNFHRLPNDIDIVVGIPRSGILAANLLSLVANIPMTDLDRFLERKMLTAGTTKVWRGLGTDISKARRILVVDDSIDSGKAMEKARKQIFEQLPDLADKVMFAAIYGRTLDQDGVDFVFEAIPQPRIFQWNILHHAMIERACVDIDGVLCLDPTMEQNDDGPAYEKFLAEATPLLRITRRIGYLVTSRLEKYRPHTEAWLKASGVEYNKLIMLDLPSAEERRRLGAHGKFKADFYRSVDCPLFIESEKGQAEYIAASSGKPVFCVETQHMLQPDRMSLPYFGQNMRTLAKKYREVPVYHRSSSIIRRIARKLTKRN